MSTLTVVALTIFVALLPNISGQQLPHIFESSTIAQVRDLPALSNGQLGFLPYSDTVHVDGLYSSVSNRTRRARLPNFARIQYEFCGPFAGPESPCRYSFDARRAVFRTQSQHRGFAVDLQTFAHRHFDRLVVNQLRVTRTPTNTTAVPIIVRLLTLAGSNSADFQLPSEDRKLWTDNVTAYSAYTLQPIESERSSVRILVQHVPESVQLSANVTEQTFVWITAFGRDSPELDAQFDRAQRDPIALLPAHEAEWLKFWTASGIAVDGNDALARTVYGSLYTLAASQPAPDRFRSDETAEAAHGVSPAPLGLSDFDGQSLDAGERWVQPIAQLLDPRWSAELIRFRTAQLPQALVNAQLHRQRGALFADDLNTDDPSKVHVTASVAFAIRQHFSATGNRTWLRSADICATLSETLRFWDYRLRFDRVAGLFDVAGVTGPDAAAPNVDNNAYTNVLAAYNLLFGEFATCECDQAFRSQYAVPLFQLAQAIRLNHATLASGDDGPFTPEHDRYTVGSAISAPDAVLLTYPLQYRLPTDTQRRNLRLYESALTGSSPTSASLHNIVRLSLGIRPSAEQFEASFVPFQRGSFVVWSENSTQPDAPQPRISASGAFVQQLIAGYAGIRVHDDRLEITGSALPPGGTSALVLNGIRYRNGVYAVRIQANGVRVTRLARDASVEIRINDVRQPQAVDEFETTNGTIVIRTIATSPLDSSRCQLPSRTTIGHRLPDPQQPEHIFTSSDVRDVRLLPALSNGYLGFLPYGDTVHLNGIIRDVNLTRRARIPNYARVQFEYCGPFGGADSEADRCRYAFDAKRAVFRTTAEYAGGYTVELDTLAHRNQYNNVLNRLRIVRKPDASLSADIHVRLLVLPGSNSDDVQLLGQTVSVWNGTVAYRSYALRAIGDSSRPRSVFVVSQTVPERVTLPAGRAEATFTWATVFERDEDTALTSFGHTQSGLADNWLYDEHVQSWSHYYADSGISVTGDNTELSRVLWSSQYALASAFRHFDVGQSDGVSPEGLGLIDYNGLTRWDAEIWVQPIALLLRPQWSVQLLRHRLQRAAEARQLARETGFEGLVYPSASDGALHGDSSRDGAKYYITGNVAHALARNYLVTAERWWLELPEACDVLADVRANLETRLRIDLARDRYQLPSVIGPNERASFVDNNAYTNALAAQNLFFGQFAACKCNQSEISPRWNRTWSDLARSILLPRSADGGQYLPEYDGYRLGTPLDEADTVLVSYPLQYALNATVVRANVRAYEAALHPDRTPSTTVAVHNVIRLRLGDRPTDEQLRRSYEPYVRGAYRVWTETPLGADANVRQPRVSASAAFVQQLVNGYAGVRVHDDRLEVINATLPPGTQSLRLNGLHYFDSVFRLEVTDANGSGRVTFVKRGENTVAVLNGVTLQQTVSVVDLRSGDEFVLRPIDRRMGECSYKSTSIDQPITAGANGMMHHGWLGTLAMIVLTVVMLN